jgi:hypothetical protein
VMSRENSSYENMDHGLLPLRVGKPFTLRGVVAALPRVNIVGVLAAGASPCCCGCCCEELAVPNWKGCVAVVGGAAASGLAAPNGLGALGTLNENEGEGV